MHPGVRRDRRQRHAPGAIAQRQLARGLDQIPRAPLFVGRRPRALKPPLDRLAG
jgi:hypothetical protein